MTTSPPEEAPPAADGTAVGPHPGPSSPAPALGRLGARRATLIGTGLIGGSVGLALRRQGWTVTGSDLAPEVAQRAVALGALDAVGVDPGAELVVVATPVHASAAVVGEFLGRTDRRTDAVVTDVGSVKGALVASIDHPYFVGGHPMAGSEQVGVDGASADLFVGASWVLTPTGRTDPQAYTRLQRIVADLGARVVALAPDRHDALVAFVSHVPHLAAASLMDLAAGLGEEHAALLQLAAGGFRDMTRVAAGRPNIWLDICDDNAEAIIAGLDLLTEALVAMRRRVAQHDREGLLQVLDRAATARRALAEKAPHPMDLVEVRVPVPDRTGVVAEIATLAAELGVNIVDLEIAHSVEGDRGVLVVVVDAPSAPTLVAALLALGYRAAGTAIGPEQ